MIYILLALYVLGAILTHPPIQTEDFEIGEQIAWVIFWPFVIGLSVLCIIGS